VAAPAAAAPPAPPPLPGTARPEPIAPAPAAAVPAAAAPRAPAARPGSPATRRALFLAAVAAASLLAGWLAGTLTRQAPAAEARTAPR
jgi:hypothetical protein